MARKKVADLPLITPAKAKNAIAVAKVLAPAVLPVVTPYLLKSAAAVRDSWDRRKARRLGIAVDDLGHYSGKGGALHARIAGAASGITELRTKPDASPQERAFADAADTRLRQLAAAIRASERMPTARRRAAHRAVSTELDQLEGRLLSALGV
ncbi:DUF6474 family protein [Actinokineospora diospyrosa]|uniref:Uncharacterized protein n=1 Tax=Actinokineospora diospyrosa TaxID=103728 RepID=A0ABT1ICU3_9PSEU|nr:DUF6474 family protein [Actinokineospora diospyrosa]MCP2270452.1 hypothetical protein [Actinokineospora diospyrosa]